MDMPGLDSDRTYALADGVRVFHGDDSEIRLRIGIWNYDEAVLDLSQEPPAFRGCCRDLFRRLGSGEVVGLHDLQAYDLDAYQVDAIVQLLDALRASGFVASPQERELSHRLARALLGNFHPWREGASSGLPNARLLFLSDSPYCTRQAAALAEEMQLPLEPAGDGLLERLRGVDLTSRMEGQAHHDALRDWSSAFAGYTGVLAVFRHLTVVPFRNLNRVVEHLGLPATVAFIDGPFVSLLGVHPPLTGCLECFELRSLARLEDHVGYHRFASADGAVGDDAGIVPLLNLLTNLAVSEGFLWAHVGTGKFSGRALNIYVPTLEIQVQDVLRVPSCPACGAVARGRWEELNVSSRVMVDRIVSRILRDQEPQLR